MPAKVGASGITPPITGSKENKTMQYAPRWPNVTRVKTEKRRSLLSALIGIVRFLWRCIIHRLTFVFICFLGGVSSALGGRDAIVWLIPLVMSLGCEAQDQRIKVYEKIIITLAKRLNLVET